MWTSSMLMASNGPPAIGESWQGGFYIGDITDSATLYHLVIAPKATGQSGTTLQYKTTSTDDTGTDSTTNGLANSNAINDADHPAAQFCRGLSIDGHSDWYLPAKDELAVVYTNRAAVAGGDAIDVDTTFYRASTEGGTNTTAWAHRFSDNTQSAISKLSSYRVRAIRRVAG